MYTVYKTDILHGLKNKEINVTYTDKLFARQHDV